MTSKSNIRLAKEILACLTDGAKIKEIYLLARQMTEGPTMTLEDHDIVLATSHPTLDDFREARIERKLARNQINRIDALRDLTDDEEGELQQHIVVTLKAWLRFWVGVDNDLIPPDKRSKPISKIKAARLLGRVGDKSAATEWITKCMKDGTIQFEKKSRQSFIFNIDQFPIDSHPKLKATHGK